QDVYNQYWKPMQDSLKDNLAEFIRHFLMKNGGRIRQNEVYLSLKETVDQRDALDYLKELAVFAQYYEKLVFPKCETDGEISQALDRLNRIEVTTAYPFLLNCYHDYKQGRVEREEFLEALITLENYLIRRFVCNVPTNQLAKIFSPLHSQVEALPKGTFVERLRAVLQSKGYPKDIEFSSRLRDSRLYGGGDRITKTKLVLEAIERSYAHKEGPSLDSVTIEHIMPQTLTDSWRSLMGDDWESTHELLLHT